jgi:uncharacterized repeat protein (TIGR03803 family)
MKIFLLAPLLLAVTLLSSEANVSAEVSILHSFGAFTNGANPQAPLILGGSGAFFGTTYGGGTNGGNGTVFRINSAGIFTTLYSFMGGTDGAGPTTLIITNGDFYGLAQNGGAFDVGTVFKITPSGTLTTLYTFTNGGDGALPRYGLAFGQNSNLYGITSSGGNGASGTVFEMTPRGILRTLHFFTGNDGASPNCLVQTSNGNFWGTTEGGGANSGNGTVFWVTANGVFKSFHSFSGGDDGGEPNGLVEDGKGNFYGTTLAGGKGGYGTIFKITSGGALSTLYSFTNGTDGQFPVAPVTLGQDGNLYGTVPGAGNLNSANTFFRMTPDGAFKALYSTPGSVDSASALVLGNDGNFYATTVGLTYSTPEATLSSSLKLGHSHDNLKTDSSSPASYMITNGTVFRITPGGAFTTLYSFTGIDDGGSPDSSLLKNGDGSLSGTTANGGVEGNIVGAIYKIALTGVFSIVYPFEQIQTGTLFTLVQANNGTYYGTDYSVGGFSEVGGNLFQITAADQFNNLFSFEDSTNGELPVAPLLQGSNGNFYGTTVDGGIGGGLGSPGYGTIYSIGTDGRFGTLYSFTNGVDGANPEAALAQGSDGNFYGCSSSGGSNGFGTIFKITAGGTFTALYSFTNGIDGDSPVTALVQGSNGNFFGASSLGGLDDYGTIFTMTPEGALSALYSFTGGSDGLTPKLLALGIDGNFYGVTLGGGTSDNGTIFQITSSGTFTSLYSFLGGNSGYEPNSIVQGSDSNFYGTTMGGGAGGLGTIFKMLAVPFITEQPPEKMNKPVGSVLNLSAAAGGIPLLHYQWQLDGINLLDNDNISGATSNMLTISALTLTNSGTYRLVADNVYGGVTSTVTALTVFADKIPPTIFISSPAPGSRGTNVVINGSASDNAQVVGVDFWLTNYDGGAIGIIGQAILGPGTTNRTWSIPAAPLPGSNTLLVQSIDFTGNRSAIRASAFFYEVSSKLTLTHTGTGTVTGTAFTRPLTNNTMLYIGESYAVVAHPARNWLFGNWTIDGSISGAGETLNFLMQPGLSVAANFVTNIFIAAEGRYHGLFAPVNIPRAQTNSGLFNLDVAGTGIFSGALRIGTNIVRLDGKFDAEGTAKITSSRRGENSLTSTLELNLADRSVQGTITDGSFSAALSGDQSVFDVDQKATNYQGRYTLVIPGTSDATVGPYGTSYGTVTVDALGGIAFGGHLADGTSISQFSVVSQSGYWPFYVSLDGGKGSLWSWIYFTNGYIVSAPSASWINPTNSAKNAPFRAGFTNELAPILGSTYRSTITPALALTNGLVVLESGNFPPITNQMTLASDNIITFVGGAENTNKLVLRIDKATGVISGSFANPSNSKQSINVSGVLLQNQTNAIGYFLGANQNGSFILLPR